MSAAACENESFTQLIERARSGDQAAAVVLMRDYEPHVRRAIRFRMRSKLLRQFLDSIDISQSVMTRFFVTLRDGELRIDTPDELIGLLVRMAQNRVCDWVRHSHAAKNDIRRRRSLYDSMEAQTVPQVSDSENMSSIESKELVHSIRSRLSPLERRLLDRRTADETWASIARAEGRSAESLRTQLRRSLKRIAVDLGLLERPQ